MVQSAVSDSVRLEVAVNTLLVLTSPVPSPICVPQTLNRSMSNASPADTIARIRSSFSDAPSGPQLSAVMVVSARHEPVRSGVTSACPGSVAPTVDTPSDLSLLFEQPAAMAISSNATPAAA